MYPMKLKIGMLDHMNNTFQNIVFQISVDVPLKVHPKLTFCDSLKKVLMALEERSYQTQCFAKILPNPLALMLYIHFYLHFQESHENVL